MHVFRIHANHLSPGPFQHKKVHSLIFSAPFPTWMTQFLPSLALVLHTQAWYSCGLGLSSSCIHHQSLENTQVNLPQVYGETTNSP